MGDVTSNVLTISGDVTVAGNIQGTIQGNVNIDEQQLANAISQASIKLDPTLMDAFGRQKISEPFTLLDSKFLTDSNPEVWDEIVENTATSVFSPGYMDLNVIANGDRVVRQTRKYNPYQPGKGLVSYITGTIEVTGNPNVTARLGLFDDHNDKNPILDTEGGGNGYFFQSVDGALSVVERTYITGSQVDTVIPQASWNVDSFDGTGPSGITLDPTKRQIYVFEMEWLGVGTASLGFFAERKLHFAHIFYHANINDIFPYITRPTLPVRYELFSTGGVGRMIQICSTVISDGGYNPLGSVFSGSNGATSVTVTTTETPVLGLRLKPGRKRTILSIINVSLQSDTANNTLFRIYRFNPPNGSVLTGDIWSNVHSRSAAELFNGNTAATFVNTGGTLLAEQYVNNQTNSQLVDLSNKFGVIAVSDIEGNSDQIIITGEAFSGGPKVFASIQWQELE